MKQSQNIEKISQIKMETKKKVQKQTRDDVAVFRCFLLSKNPGKYSKTNSELYGKSSLFEY